MPRSIADIEQELEALRKSEANLRKEKNDWLNLLSTDPSARQSLDRLNELMNNVLISQKDKIEEIKVLRERGMLLI